MGCLAVKQIRCTSEQGRPRDLLLNEVKIALELQHDNILPLFGVVQMTDSPAWCIVTPWQDLGTLGSFTKRHPSANRAKLLTQTASALTYLHGRSPPIIHSDLHIENVLVNSSGDAQLADFGLSKVFDAAVEQDPGSSRSAYPGVLVYQPPELHGGEKRTTATDVFAFGMLVVHAYSGRRPLVSATNDMAIIVALSQGLRPDRTEVTREDFSELMWEQAQACWAQEPTARPAISVVHALLEPTVPPDGQLPTEDMAESIWLMRQEKDRFAADGQFTASDAIRTRLGGSMGHLSQSLLRMGEQI
ncbi:kinase-like protein [Auricularia subglabra TFB-10046 SS5]|nr:kinase-like protein [Auricularia subglabra TFB-10046 SS5]